jgi:hypothetical protein
MFQENSEKLNIEQTDIFENMRIKNRFYAHST